MAGGTGDLKPLTGSVIGRIIVCVYVQLLELKKAYAKTSPLTKKELEIEDSVHEKKTVLILSTRRPAIIRFPEVYFFQG